MDEEDKTVTRARALLRGMGICAIGAWVALGLSLRMHGRGETLVGYLGALSFAATGLCAAAAAACGWRRRVARYGTLLIAITHLAFAAYFGFVVALAAHLARA